MAKFVRDHTHKGVPYKAGDDVPDGASNQTLAFLIRRGVVKPTTKQDKAIAANITPDVDEEADA